MNSKIRKAQSGDLPEMQRISREVIDQNYRCFLGDDAVDHFIDSGMADAYIAEMIEHATLILVNDEIAGMCICKENLIDLLMVDTRFQRLGLGKTLLDHVVAGIFEKYGEARLESFEDNHRANAFYDQTRWQIDIIEVDESLGIRKIYYHKLKNND
jgi:ribosomal protein S18 acetylase RimI-like enzyme